MDFATRDRYRHTVERIAKEGRLTEAEVASEAIELAAANASRNGDADRTAHVGFFLIDEGLPELERAAGIQGSMSRTGRRIARQFPLQIYLGAIGLLTGGLAAGLVASAHRAGAGRELLSLVVVLSLLAASQLAVTIVNWLAMRLVTPHSLPRMDFSAGIAARARTMVVVPTMITSARNVEDLVEALEVRFLANRDAHLHFALLTDFPDAREETLPDDEPLLRLAEERINELNLKYSTGKNRAAPSMSPATKAIPARPRATACSTCCTAPVAGTRTRADWMGEERKRGKLADLNAFLRGGNRDRFSLIVGATAVLPEIKYVITLDTDTQLPRDAARQFAGAMAHPLNAPHFGKHPTGRTNTW